MLLVHAMHDIQEPQFINCVPCYGIFFIVFLKCIIKRSIIRFSFVIIRNNQGLSKCYQPLLISAVLVWSLIILDTTKTSFSNYV